MTPSKTPAEILNIAGSEVRISSPDKMVFPEPGLTKLDLVRYSLAVAVGALRGAGGRPMVLKRFPKGIDAEPFFQKRVPENHPDFIDTTTLHYASGTSAEETVIRDAAGLAWVVNLGCLDLNPHPVRAEDLEHPDVAARLDCRPYATAEGVDLWVVSDEIYDRLSYDAPQRPEPDGNATPGEYPVLLDPPLHQIAPLARLRNRYRYRFMLRAREHSAQIPGPERERIRRAVLERLRAPVPRRAVDAGLVEQQHDEAARHHAVAGHDDRRAAARDSEVPTPGSGRPRRPVGRGEGAVRARATFDRNRSVIERQPSPG